MKFPWQKPQVDPYQRVPEVLDPVDVSDWKIKYWAEHVVRVQVILSLRMGIDEGHVLKGAVVDARQGVVTVGRFNATYTPYLYLALCEIPGCTVTVVGWPNGRLSTQGDLAQACYRYLQENPHGSIVIEVRRS